MNSIVKRLSQKIGYGLYVAVIVVILLELLLRLLWYEPYHYQAFSIQSEPKQCILPDSLLGFQLNPGQFNVTVNKGLHFRLTHNAQQNRITAPKSAQANFYIQLHGCSYTYGFGIDDSLAMAYRLQQALDSTVYVESKAVLGYGTVQSYLLLQSAIDSGNIPDMVIINYASFHDERNALTPNYRKDLKNGFAHANQEVQDQYESLRFPYVAFKDDSLVVKWEKWDEIYQNYPYREYSALVNLIQTISDKWTTSHYRKTQLTERLFIAIQELCNKHHIELLITGITKDERTVNVLQSCKTHKINTLDMSLNLLDTAYHNYPYDSHPNAQAHGYFTDALVRYITDHDALVKKQ